MTWCNRVYIFFGITILAQGSDSLLKSVTNKYSVVIKDTSFNFIEIMFVNNHCTIQINKKTCFTDYTVGDSEKELRISYSDDQQCADIEVSPSRRDVNVIVVIPMDKAFWFGGSELQYQAWPLANNLTLPFQPFTTNDIVPLNQSFGNVIERYLVSSNGFGVYVSEGPSLYAGMITLDENMKFLYMLERSYVEVGDQAVERKPLIVHVCKTDDILQTHVRMSKQFFDKADTHPDSRMIKSPIWSTWAKYKVDINQEKVLEYASEIVNHGFSNSQIEIDDMFSSTYGEFDFDVVKFPDPKTMMNKLAGLGFRVTVWITPFANLDSPVFTEGLQNGYWLKDISGTVPALVRWWQGTGAILDVENEDAVNWYLERLENMRSRYGIHSFKFDAGEAWFVPKVHEHSLKWRDPTVYTTKYVAAVSRMRSSIEVRCGYRTQKYPIFVRMGDKESRWGLENGLQTLIPTILTLGILGYPYILPDMIGGNGYVYSSDVDNPYVQTELPDRELYIRWLQITAYMPAMQFSFVPWQYDEEVVRIAKKFVKIHEDKVTPIILEAAEVAQIDGYPLIRPLWWIAPKDLQALECSDEFLVGDRLLVAPVVTPKARERDIYLPKGLWEDVHRGFSVEGESWLRSYRAELDEVPVFLLRK